MNEFEAILTDSLTKRQDILKAIVAGRATASQRRVYKSMKRDASRRANKWA